MNLRACTFNIRNGRAFDGWHSWPFRRASTARVVTELNADVLGIQEAFQFQLRWLLGRVGDYTAIGESRNRGKGGELCPVLVRSSRLRVIDSTTRWYSSDPEQAGSRLPGASFPRVAVTVDLEAQPEGTTFQFVNTHLDERRSANRLQSAEMLTRWLDRRKPRVVVGDFNATAEDPLFDVLAAAGLRPALPAAAPGTAHRFTGRTDGARIDHILVSEEWEVSDARVETNIAGRVLPSDHWPVVADLRLC